MARADLWRFDLEDPVHGQVPGAALLHPDHLQRELPRCLMLYGGGGSRESLASLQPSIERAWATGELAPCIIATPDVGPWSFYLDDPARGLAWESFIIKRFAPHLHTLQRPAPASLQRLGVIGMSMGGYGALKLAFAHPQLFAAVGAVSPMVEPFAAAAEVPLRNRFFYPPEVPQALLGSNRDAALYQADHPAARAHANVHAVLEHELAIYIDAAGRDALNAHDGAESLHRVLWELDVPHEYHLRRDADHAGPDLAPRMCEALRWVVEHLQPTAANPWSELEQAWLAWLYDPGTQPPAAALPPDSPLFPRFLRATLESQRRAAQLQDPTLSRHYGTL
jgi:S-formylglutathione hydrolase